jgi:putative restriction endonuclease
MVVTSPNDSEAAKMAVMTIPAQIKSRQWRLKVSQADAPQIRGGYVWAPRKPAGRGGSQARLGITLITPGDLVFAFAQGRLVAIGIAMERARGCPDPDATSGDGWLVPVRFEGMQPTSDPVTPAAPGRQRPAERGESLLTEMPDSDARSQRRLLSGQVEAFEDRIRWETDGRLAEQALEAKIWLRADIEPASKRQLSTARTGAGLFRENVERLESACRVTGVVDRRYLRATHIKPWREASDDERVDGANGLLLSPHAADLFRRGQLSFSDEGALLVSKHLNPYVLKAWNLVQQVPARPFRPEQRAYLAYHRSRLYERAEGGRRTPPAPQELP